MYVNLLNIIYQPNNKMFYFNRVKVTCTVFILNKCGHLTYCLKWHFLTVDKNPFFIYTSIYFVYINT